MPNLLPLTKKFLDFLEKATEPIAPRCPLPTPIHLLLSASHNLTYKTRKDPLNRKQHKKSLIIKKNVWQPSNIFRIGHHNLQYCLCSQLQQVFSQIKIHRCQGKQQFQCGQPTHTNMTLLQHHKHEPVFGCNSLRNSKYGSIRTD
jgi:hypothetical protein